MAETFTPYTTASGFVVIVAKHPGTCDRCNGPVAVGELVKWRKPTMNPRTGRPVAGYVVHKDACPTAAPIPAIA